MRGLFRPPQLVLVYLCVNAGPQGLIVVRLPALFIPHSRSLGPATSTRVFSTLAAVSAPPTSLDECLFFISLVSNFLAVQFSVSACCARRHSVSTYAAILVLFREVRVSHETTGSPSPLPSAQSNSYAKVAHLGEACSEPLQAQIIF